MSAGDSLDRVGGIFEEIPADAWRQGADLAIELFDQFDLNSMTLDEECREGRPQDNAVYRFLCLAQQAGEAQVMAFCAVVCEYVACTVDDAGIDVELVKQLTRRPVAQAVQP